MGNSAFPSLRLHPELSTTWLWCGNVTDISATINIHNAVGAAKENAGVSLLVSTNADFSSPFFTEVLVTSEQQEEGDEENDNGDENDQGNQIDVVYIEDLTARTQYYYSLISSVTSSSAAASSDTIISHQTGSFRTFPAQSSSVSEPVTVGLASCARSGSNAAVFDTLADMNLDLFIQTGDLYYADIAKNDTALFDDAYNTVFKAPRYRRLLTAQAIAYVWDDHDFGPNDADSTSGSAPAAKTSYRSKMPHYPLIDDEAIYQSFALGTTLFIMTDLVSEKRVGEYIFSAKQEQWLFQQLARGRDDYLLTVWVSSKPWIGPPDTNGDSWLGFPDTRLRISQFIIAKGIANLVMVAGDAHCIAIDDGTNTDYSGGSTGLFPLMQAAPLDKYGTSKGGPYSSGCNAYTLASNNQYGLLHINGSCITMSGYVDGNNGPKIQYSGCAPFLPSGGGVVGGGQGSCSIELAPAWVWAVYVLFLIFFIFNLVMVIIVVKQSCCKAAGDPQPRRWGWICSGDSDCECIKGSGGGRDGGSRALDRTSLVVSKAHQEGSREGPEDAMATTVAAVAGAEEGEEEAEEEEGEGGGGGGVPAAGEEGVLESIDTLDSQQSPLSQQQQEQLKQRQAYQRQVDVEADNQGESQASHQAPPGINDVMSYRRRKHVPWSACVVFTAVGFVVIAVAMGVLISMALHEIVYVQEAVFLTLCLLFGLDVIGAGLFYI